MAFKKFEFPMNAGVIAEGGTCYLGLASRDKEGAFVLYNMEENKIVQDLEHIDVKNWRVNGELRERPAGVSDQGAWFVSNYILSEEDGQPVGLQVSVYNKEDGSLRTVIPVSEGIKDWPTKCQLMAMAKVEDQLYMVAYYDTTGQNTFKIFLYDDEIGQSQVIWDSPAPRCRFFDVKYHPETRTISLKKSEEFFYMVYDLNNFEYFELQLSEDYRECELTEHYKVKQMPDKEHLTETLRIDTRKLGILKGKQHVLVDEQTDNVILELKENMNTVYDYYVLGGLDSILVAKSAVVAGNAVYYLIVGYDTGYEVEEVVELNSKAEVSYDDEEGYICLSCKDKTVVLKEV